MSDEFDDAEDPHPARRIHLPPVERTRRQRLKALPRLVADAYADAAGPLKVRLLECLLQPVGPLALVAIGAGAFGKLLYQDDWRHLHVPIETALRVSGEQMMELARYVEQASPDVIDQLGAVLADTPMALTTISSSLLLLALRRWQVGRAPNRMH